MVTKSVHRLFIVVFPFEWPEISRYKISVFSGASWLILLKLSSMIGENLFKKYQQYCQSSETFADDQTDDSLNDTLVRSIFQIPDIHQQILGLLTKICSYASIVALLLTIMVLSLFE